MSNVNRTAIMTRTWAIFRQTYRYPRIKFSSIGRHCVNAQRHAQAEAKSAVGIAATSAAAKADRITTFTDAMHSSAPTSIGPSARVSITAMRARILQLSG